MESEKGMSWTIGSPNGGATGGGPGIGCIGWKGLASAVHQNPFLGKEKLFLPRGVWDFWIVLLFFFGIFLLKLLHFRCVAFVILFIGSFSLIFRTRWYNSGLSDGSPLGGKASPWRFGKRKSHLHISRKEPKQLTWRAGWERERLILSFISAKLYCPLLDFVSSGMRIFWDPSKAWFIRLGIFQVDLGGTICHVLTSRQVQFWSGCVLSQQVVSGLLTFSGPMMNSHVHTYASRSYLKVYPSIQSAQFLKSLEASQKAHQSKAQPNDLWLRWQVALTSKWVHSSTPTWEGSSTSPPCAHSRYPRKQLKLKRHLIQ